MRLHSITRSYAFPPPRERECIALRNQAVDEAARYYAGWLHWTKLSDGGVSKGRRVVRLSTGRVYRSTREASRAVGDCSHMGIHRCCDERRGDWRWADEH